MKNYSTFEAAFTAYWKLLMQRYQTGEEINYYTKDKNKVERRQLELINEKQLRLREMTDNGTRVSTRERKKPLPPEALSSGNEYNWKLSELQETFQRLYERRDELKNFTLKQIPKEFGARGYIEYGREMFEEFCRYIGEE